MGLVWCGSHEHKRTSFIYVCDLWQASVIFCWTGLQKTHDARTARCACACGGKLGAGTVEAEEDTYMDEWVCGFVLLSARADNAVQISRQTGRRESPMCFVLSSALG